MNKENIIKGSMLIGFLFLFLYGSRLKSEGTKVICIEQKCERPHDHGQLNFHEKFPVTNQDNFGIATDLQILVGVALATFGYIVYKFLLKKY